MEQWFGFTFICILLPYLFLFQIKSKFRLQNWPPFLKVIMSRSFLHWLKRFLLVLSWFIRPPHPGLVLCPAKIYWHVRSGSYPPDLRGRLRASGSDAAIGAQASCVVLVSCFCSYATWTEAASQLSFVAAIKGGKRTRLTWVTDLDDIIRTHNKQHFRCFFSPVHAHLLH